MEVTVFHKILAGELPAEVVYEDDGVLAFMDITPVTPGHVLVIGKHVEGENMYSSPIGSLHKVFEAVHKLGPQVAKAVGADGFTVVMNNGEASGQTVFYPHVHILPLKQGEYRPLPKLDRSAEEIASDAELIRKTIQ